MTTAQQVQRALAELEGIAADLSKKAQQAENSEIGGQFARAAAHCWTMHPLLRHRYEEMLKEEPQYKQHD
ncbi:MAG: hypothetical protein ACM3ZQ_03805 [Bacillota bacterium]